MRTAGKKLTAILLSLAVWAVSFGGSILDYGKVVLDVSEQAGATYADALSAEVSIPGGRMFCRVPKTFLSVEAKLEGTDGVQYRLNEIPETFNTSAEQLYVFYFESEKYLLYAKDAKNVTAVEMAIVENILPGEKVGGIVNGWNFPSASKHNKKGTAFDYYSGEYTDVNKKTHHVEFVFTADGDRGLGCLLYVFTDPVHKDDVLYVMNSIHFAK